MRVHWAEVHDPFTLCGEEVGDFDDYRDEVTDVSGEEFVVDPDACVECKRDIEVCIDERP